MKDNKKVIFVNTSIQSLIEYSYVVIEKLQVLFNGFNESEEYFIWWRPHPLIEKELRQVDSSLYDEYKKLQSEFKTGKYRYLDESDSIDPALEVADIYYGDIGTVSKIFEDNGKKVIFPKYTGSFFPIGICKYRNYIYGTCHDTSGIVRYSLADEKWEYITPIIQTYGMQKAFHNSVVIDDRIIFIPYKADCLAILNMKENKVDVIELKLDKSKHGKYETNFWGFYHYKNILYILPASYSEVLAINLENYKVEPIIDLCGYVDTNQIITWLSWEEIMPGVVMLVSMIENAALILDFNKRTKLYFKIGKATYKYTEIRKNRDAMYFIVKNEPIILEWRYKDDCISEIEFDDDFGEHGKSIFDDYANCIYQDILYLFPAKSRAAYSIDLKTKEVCRLTKLDAYLNDEISLSQFDTVVVADGRVYLQSSLNHFLTFDLSRECVVADSECKLSIEDITRMELDLIKY